MDSPIRNYMSWYIYLHLPLKKYKNQPNVGEYTIHGSYGYEEFCVCVCF